MPLFTFYEVGNKRVSVCGVSQEDMLDLSNFFQVCSRDEVCLHQAWPRHEEINFNSLISLKFEDRRIMEHLTKSSGNARVVI